MDIGVDYISYLSIYIPALVGIFSFRIVDSPVRLLIFYVLLTALLEIFVDILKDKGLNNLFLFHIHTFIEFSFLIVFFGNLIVSKYKVNILNFISLTFLLTSVLLLIFHQGFSEFNSVQRHVEGFMVCSVILLYLTERSMNVKRLFTTPHILLSWTLLVYFGGNLFVFALGDVILTTGDGELWAIHGVLNILLNLVFAYFILVQRRKKKLAG